MQQDDILSGLMALKLEAGRTDVRLLRGPHLKTPALLLTSSLEKDYRVHRDTNSSHACALFPC